MENAFGARFNCDVIDWGDKEGALFDAEVVVDNLRFVGLSTEEIIGPIKETLNNWGPEVIEEYCDVTNTDWLFDSESTELLKAILIRMIEYAEK